MVKTRFIMFITMTLFTAENIIATSNWQGDFYNKNSQLQVSWFEQFSATLPISGSEDVLDIGCGDGKLTHDIANRLINGSIVGIDNSKSMIDFAKKSHQKKNLSFSIADARYLKLNKKFDLIVSFTALHWIKEYEQVIERVKEHLKPHGKIYFVFSTKWLGSALDKAMNSLYRHKQWAPYFQNYDPGYYSHDVDPFMTTLLKNNFDIKEISLRSKLNIFDSDDKLFSWLKAWLPQQHQVPAGKGDQFIKDFITEYKNYGTTSAKGIHWDGFLMKVEASLKTSMPQNPTKSSIVKLTN